MAGSADNRYFLRHGSRGSECVFYNGLPCPRLNRSPPRAPSKREVRPNGVVWVAVGATLWGTDAVLRRPLTGTLSSAEIVFFEHLILALVLLPTAIRIWPRRASFTKGQWAALLWIGWGGSALATIFFTQAIKLGNPTAAVFLQKLQPLFAVLAARVWLRESELSEGRFRARLVVAVGAALLISGALDSGFASGPWKAGSLWAVAAALIWGTSTVAGRSMFPAVSPLEMTALRVLTALPLLTALVLAGSPDVSLPAPEAGQLPDAVVVGDCAGFARIAVLLPRAQRDVGFAGHLGGVMFSGGVGVAQLGVLGNDGDGDAARRRGAPVGGGAVATKARLTYSVGGINNIATTLTAKHAAAIRLVYPTISPNRNLATASSGIAQNG